MAIEVFSIVNSFAVASHKPPVIISNPNYIGNREILNLNTLTSSMDVRFSNIINNIISTNSCPLSAAPVNILLNPQNVTVIIPKLTYPNYVVGNYYKIPVSPQLGSSGEPVPKYSLSIPAPYFGFIYPPEDIDYGYMLVKTLIPITIVPNDVTIINESQVLSELKRVVQAIFAM